MAGALARPLRESDVRKTSAWKWLALASCGALALGAAWALLRLYGEGRVKPLPGISTIRPPFEVSALALDDENVWAGGRDGVFRIDRKQASLGGPIEADVPLRYVRALLREPGGPLWIGHLGGLTRLEEGRCRTLTRLDGLPDDRVNALALDRTGRLWAGTWGGAAVREGASWKSYTTRDGLLDDMVNVLHEDARGGLWFGSFTAPRGGLTILQGGAARHFTTREGLPHNNVNAILEDPDGSVWVGTGYLDRGGLCRFVLKADGWVLDKVYTKPDGLSGFKVRSLLRDRDGVLWIGSEYDGMSLWDGRRWGYLTVTDGLSSPETKVAMIDSDGSLWMGTSSGVTVIRGERFLAVREFGMKRKRP